MQHAAEGHLRRLHACPSGLLLHEAIGAGKHGVGHTPDEAVGRDDVVLEGGIGPWRLAKDRVDARGAHVLEHVVKKGALERVVNVLFAT